MKDKTKYPRPPLMQVWNPRLNMLVEQVPSAIGEQIAEELDSFEEEPLDGDTPADMEG